MFYWETRPCTHRSQFVDGSLVVILLFITLIETTTGRAGEARERERVVCVRVEWQVQEHRNCIFINDILVGGAGER